MAIVYVHVNKFNDKKYFGRSDNSALGRWGNQGIGYKGQKFYSEGIDKYGWDNFIHKILIDDITTAQSIALETFLINEYNTINNGYNETSSFCSEKALKEIQPLGLNLKKIIDNLTNNNNILAEESLETIQKVNYNYRNTTYPLRVIKDLWDNNQIFTELDIQRGLVWNEKQQQELWDTLLYGARIPEVHARVENDNSYSLMDGKQRITNCIYIISDKIPLKKSTLRNEKHQRFLTNHNLSSILFSQLPKNLQDRILSNNINFAEYFNMSDEEMADFFKKLNNGTSLSEFQKTISQNFIFRKNILLPIIIQNSFLQDFFTDKKREKNQDELFVLKTLYLFCLKNIEMETIKLKPENAQYMIDYIQQSNTIIAIQQLTQLLTIFNEINIIPQDFERENKKGRGIGKRINDSLRPFIFLVFKNNLDKKYLFKDFLKVANLNTTADDRMTPETALKYYHMVLSEFNRLISKGD